MTGKCVAISIRSELRESSSMSKHVNPEYQISIGKEYTVLGVTFLARSPVYGSMTILMVQDDAGRCIDVPSPLMEIVDPRPSQYWRARGFDDASFMLWPEEFYEDFFYDNLSEGVPEVVRTYKQVVRRLDAEFGDCGNIPSTVS